MKNGTYEVHLWFPSRHIRQYLRGRKIYWQRHGFSVKSLGLIIETPGFLTEYTGKKNLEILADLNRKISAGEIRRGIAAGGT